MERDGTPPESLPVSAHFGLSELIRSTIAQAAGIPNEPGDEIKNSLRFTMAGLERVRACLESKPIQVLSGYRSYDLNVRVGGAKNSQHMKGEAADFICPDFGKPWNICARLSGNMQVLGIDQLILEQTWVHVSFTLEPRYEILTSFQGEYLPGIVLK